MINVLKFDNFILESISKKEIIAYHRTKSWNYFTKYKLQKDYKVGFIPGNGASLGKGLYATYDLESQKKNYMYSYGFLLLKISFSPENILILDYNEAKKVYGGKYKLLSQLNLLLKDKFKDLYIKYKKELILWNKELMNTSYSGRIAKKIISLGITNNISGIIYTGENGSKTPYHFSETDAKCVVLYDVSRIKILEYSKDDGKTWKQLNKP